MVEELDSATVLGFAARGEFLGASHLAKADRIVKQRSPKSIELRLSLAKRCLIKELAAPNWQGLFSLP